MYQSQSKEGDLEVSPAEQQEKIESDIRTTSIPNYDKAKYSSKKNGIVKAYAANTNQGIIRNYNEDRVSIILNIMKPNNEKSEREWPKCSFFAVYDGHGGVACADFLRDNLHQMIIKDQNFPWNPEQALRNGFQAAEQQFLKMAVANNQGKEEVVDRSGSCAVVVLIIGNNNNNPDSVPEFRELPAPGAPMQTKPHLPPFLASGTHRFMLVGACIRDMQLESRGSLNMIHDCWLNLNFVLLSSNRPFLNLTYPGR